MNHEEDNNNPLFHTRSYSGVSERLSFRGRVMEVPSNPTQRSLSLLTGTGDSALHMRSGSWEKGESHTDMSSDNRGRIGHNLLAML